MRLSDRAARFFATSALAARVYLGYKAITVAEKRLGLKDADERRSRHHTDSARRLYDVRAGREEFCHALMEESRPAARYVRQG